MKHVFTMFVGAAVISFASSAFAEEPKSLSTSQLDGITAGFEFANADGFTGAFGDVTSDTFSFSTAIVAPGSAFAENTTGGVASSLFFAAASTSQSTSAAALD